MHIDGASFTADCAIDVHRFTNRRPEGSFGEVAAKQIGIVVVLAVVLPEAHRAQLVIAPARQCQGRARARPWAIFWAPLHVDQRLHGSVPTSELGLISGSRSGERRRPNPSSAMYLRSRSVRVTGGRLGLKLQQALPQPCALTRTSRPGIWHLAHTVAWNWAGEGNRTPTLLLQGA